ncbi:hypothetical protein JOQ06_021786 [Pogonophryne albipinna]|uniref:Uncharacterized protein n=1 Tax=Pogonophryne albipinna TaxID=1090488 RepID=A0AAD6ACV4_9TELE|nr:hypothetical protein JOQ06_021786 [Pogonophryne albipinna]
MEDCIGRCEEEKEGHEEERMERTLVLEMMLQNGVKPGPINSMVFTKPVPNRMVQTGEGSGFCRGMVGPLPDPCLFRVTEAYSALKTMNMRPDKPLVESAFGIVQEGSVLSYQMPALTSLYTTRHTDTPPTPPLPIEGWNVAPLSSRKAMPITGKYRVNFLYLGCSGVTL